MNEAGRSLTIRLQAELAAAQEAKGFLNAEEIKLIERFGKISKVIFEDRTVKNEREKQSLVAECFSLVPGSREVYEKWEVLLRTFYQANMGRFN